MTALVVVEAVAIALLGLLVAGLLRSHADILRTLHQAGLGDLDSARPRTSPGPVPVPFGVQPGVAAPRPEETAAVDIAGVTPYDEAVSVAVVGTPTNTLLAFLSSGCLTCAGFWSAFGGRPELPADTRLVVVTKGAAEESVAKVHDLAPAGVAVVMSSEAWADYAVPGSPYFLLVEGLTGVIRGEGAASSWKQVVNLMAEAGADSEVRRSGGRGRSGPEREMRTDRELSAAGILPGHPSLYPTAGE